MLVELCTFNYKFHKRYHWVLSSLSQQSFKNFSVTTDLCEEDSFNNIEETKKLFPDLEFTFNEHSVSDMNRRGFIRSKNIKNAKAEWLLFLDADNVFHPDFFANLETVLLTITDADKTKLISIPRLTMAQIDGYGLIDSEPTTNVIVDAYKKASVIKTWYSRRGRVSGAGYFQLVHVPSMNKLGISSYVDGSYDVPLLSSKSYYRMKSDMVFRRKFTGILPVKSLPPIIHINHYRREKDALFDAIECH